MTALYVARRLRQLTDTAPRCAGFVPAPRAAHPFCLRCGGEEWPHVARGAAELLEAFAPAPAPGDTSDRADDDAPREIAAPAIDITNDQLVAVNQGSILVLQPRCVMTPAAAIVHAAWLVVLAEIEGAAGFRTVYERVKRT